MQSVGFEVRITGSCNVVKCYTKSVYPQSRAHHGACLHENWIYILAGKDGNITLKDFWRFHLGKQIWEKLNYRGDLPHHLQGHTLLSFKKLLLLFGGEFGDALTESSLWIINPDLGYVRKASLDVGSDRPCVRRYHSAVIYRDSMYVYGGYVDVKGSSSEFWRYNVEDEEWELLLPLKRSHDQPGRRYGHSAVIYKQAMWLYGGMNNLIPKQDLWTYSFISERWERIKCKIAPPPLTGHSAVVVGSQMVVYGGETNRQPVNQVWIFNFCTQKWTQVLFLGPDPPSKTMHVSVVVNPATFNEVTVQARSTPYLQNKTKDQIKRPRSSPGYRMKPETIHKDNQNIPIFERTVSAIEIDRQKPMPSRSDCCSVCSASVGYPHERSISNQGIYIYPSPSENCKDIVPLVPSDTDINYNDVYVLDKDSVNKGLVNRGISDSTEKLIEESQNFRQCRGCSTKPNLIYDDHQSTTKPNLIDDDHQSTTRDSKSSEKRKLCGECVRFANKSSTCKKCRPDPDLILEDIEFQDCFPCNVQVPFPINSQISLQTAWRNSRDIETIELQDISHTHDYGGNVSIVPSNTTSQLTNYDIFTVMEKSRVGNENQDAQPPLIKLDCDNVPQELETYFQHVENRHPKTQHACSEGITTLPQMNVPERPYMLVIGGRDKEAVNFTTKPLTLFKVGFTWS